MCPEDNFFILAFRKVESKIVEFANVSKPQLVQHCATWLSKSDSSASTYDAPPTVLKLASTWDWVLSTRRTSLPACPGLCAQLTRRGCFTAASDTRMC